MNKMFSEVVEAAGIIQAREALGFLGKDLTDAVAVKKAFQGHLEQVEVLKNLVSGKYKGPKVNMNEALRANDMSILFPKVISDVMMKPKEPLMIGQTLLAKTVHIDNVRSVEFPTLGALQAFDMGETMEYREQLLSIGEEASEVKTNKVGLMVALSEEVINDSMWDILSLYMEAAGYALDRFKEQKIFNEFSNHGHVVFDNALANAALNTGGKDSLQVSNGAITFDDFIDVMGGLIANEYIPTDILMHPLAWTVFAKDPVLRNVFYTQSQVGQTIWSAMPDFDQQMNMPWNMSYQVTPFAQMNLNYVIPTGPFSGLAAANVTNITILDRQNACVVLQREDVMIDKFDDPRRDIQMMKFRERYGIGTLNGGRAIAQAKNVRCVPNYRPIEAVYQVSPS